MLKGNIPYFFRRGTKRDGVLGTTRCGSQGYSVYLLYDVLLSFDPSMDEGVCTWKKSYWMDHYSKTKSVSDEPEGKKEPCDIQVKSGSKIRNIISQAMRILQVGLWTGDRRNGPINIIMNPREFVQMPNQTYQIPVCMRKRNADKSLLLGHNKRTHMHVHTALEPGPCNHAS